MFKVYTISWKYKKKYKRRLYVDSKDDKKAILLVVRLQDFRTQ